MTQEVHRIHYSACHIVFYNFSANLKITTKTMKLNIISIKNYTKYEKSKKNLKLQLLRFVRYFETHFQPWLREKTDITNNYTTRYNHTKHTMIQGTQVTNLQYKKTLHYCLIMVWHESANIPHHYNIIMQYESNCLNVNSSINILGIYQTSTVHSAIGKSYN